MAFENELRNVELVQRWGIIRCFHPGNVGGHSHRVVIYADQIAEILEVKDGDTRARIMRHAAWHDVAEILTNDIPSPVKKEITDPKKLEDFERREMVNRFCSLEWSDTDPRVVGIVKVADLLDAVLHIVVEKRLGNTLIEYLYDPQSQNLLRAISALQFSDRLCTELRAQIVNAIGRHVYMPLHTVQ